MPEVAFRIRWPDGVEEECYSPSTVVASFLLEGQAYLLDDFLDRAHTALTRASDRVRARFGRPCSLALAQLARIEGRAAAFAGEPDASVACLSLTSKGPIP